MLFFVSGSQLELWAQLLLMSVRRARRHPCVSSLTRASQDRVLRGVWPRLLLLGAAHWPLELTTLQSHEGVVAAVVGAVKAAALEPLEVALLETLLLCRPGMCIILH